MAGLAESPLSTLLINVNATRAQHAEQKCWSSRPHMHTLHLCSYGKQTKERQFNVEGGLSWANLLISIVLREFDNAEYTLGISWCSLETSVLNLMVIVRGGTYVSLSSLELNSVTRSLWDSCAFFRALSSRCQSASAPGRRPGNVSQGKKENRAHPLPLYFLKSPLRVGQLSST